MKLPPRVALIIIAALFIVPLALAWLMYSGQIDYRPASTRNFGSLVQPPLPMSWSEVTLRASGQQTTAEAALSRHWVVVYRVPPGCPQGCMAEAADLRQVHRATGRQQSRIRIALLLPDERQTGLEDQLAAIYQDFQLISDPSGTLRAALDQASAGSRSYLIDPLGNIMMSYEAGFDPNHLKQDLKRLLTWSKLDEQ